MQCNSSETPAMDKRRAELLDLSSYVQTVDNDVTMILQSLQWDRKHLIEATPMSSCSYDNNHRVPPAKLEDHEKECLLRILGYSKEDLLLPDPPDGNSDTLVKLSNDDVANIIEYAAKINPVFKTGRGAGPGPALPLSLERLQHAYSADERRAIHDAVVSAVPACHDLVELALLGNDGEGESSKPKSRAEILSGLRDMKRRRTKYRGAPNSRNYCHVLRDLIATQMEHFSVVQDGISTNNTTNNKTNKPQQFREDQIKKEPLEDKSYSEGIETRRNPSKEYENHHRDKSKEESRRRHARDETRHKDRRDKYKREEVYDDYNRDKPGDDRRHRDERDRHSSSSKERRDRKDYRSDSYREDSSNYSKERSRDRNEYRNDKYREERRNYKEYKYSTNRGHKRDYDYENYREDKHKRYEHKQDEGHGKRIKQEKTE